VGDAPVPRKKFERLIISENNEALAEKASELVLSFLVESLSQGGRSRVILAGGLTPKMTYNLVASGIRSRSLSAGAIDWYFGDERWVLPDDPQSNERMARESLLWQISAPESTIHSWMSGRGDPVECAGRYGEVIQTNLQGEVPDILLLGIGSDGHTASLFPGATAYLPDGQKVPVARRLSPEFPAAAIQGVGTPPGWRLTLCPDFLRKSRHVVFIAAGPDKSSAVHRAMDGDPRTPAAWIRGITTHFIVTRDATAQQE